MIDRVAEPEPDELVTIVGPTASGKSELAMILAERWGGEIVGADSVQIYRRFDLGSGKPSAEERARVPHYLVDALDPLAPFDAASFVARADAAIADIRARGRTPLVCGGTFLWIKALLHGLAPMPSGDPTIRARHERIAADEGRAALHAELARVDPESAERLAPNDFVRVSRALEVWEQSGKTLSAWHAEHGFASPRYRGRLIGRERARDDIDERIRARTQKWLAEGWIGEVQTLLDDGFLTARAMDSVGYRQVREHLDGIIPHADLEDTIVRATRAFVRHQRTWLRDQPVTWL